MPAASIKVPLAVKAGVTLAALVSLLGLTEYARFESAYQRQNADPYKVTAQFSRFADVRAAVPATATLGYLSDQPLGGTAGDALFNSAQYVLAPRLLQKDAAENLVLGNFTRQADFAAVGAQSGLHIERNFGNGVVLFRRDGR
ncbi:MAG TPA: hypothetical protein VMT15_13040 [Bryobacteraceae bacterium]|nr:hypothetical protein [Bryobacteraceae bacterium]